MGTTKNKMISAIISTYNRERFLPKLFESIQTQSLDNSQFEIIIVDNNSPGNTKDLTSEFKKSSTFTVKYFLELQQGLSYARNRGIKEAKGDVIIFVDDDAILDENYFEKLDYYFITEKETMAIGSKIFLKYESPKPPLWENKHLNSLHAYFNLGNKKKYFSKSKYPIGTNMSFRKEVFEKIGDFNVTLGRVKSGLGGGEEKDIFMRMYANKMKVLYVPDAIVHHRIPEERTKSDFIKRQALGIGKSEKIRTTQLGLLNYFSRILEEGTKWIASIVLFFAYLFILKPHKGIMIVRFRYWVSLGLLFDRDNTN
tara:strand:- start:9260 stop:10195 length:936 start_codon:yes stop_codon:yes gene_type:complete